MVSRRTRHVAKDGHDTGFSLAELIVVIAVIGVLAVLAMPTFLTYWRGATLRGGAQEVTAVLNAGRQLAIRENQTVCIRGNAVAGSYGTELRYTLGSCLPATSTVYCNPSGGTTTNCVWRGAGTDSAGYLTLSNRLQVRAPATDVTFSYLGAAVGGVFSVCNPDDTVTHANVTVANSGRISTTYQNTGC